MGFTTGGVALTDPQIAAMQSALIALGVENNGKPTGYAASGTHFGAVDIYLERATPMTISNGPKGTLSVWYNDEGRPSGANEDNAVLGHKSAFGGVGCGFYINIYRTDTQLMILNFSAGDSAGNGHHKLTFLPLWKPSAWNHILMGWDFTNTPGLFSVALNGVQVQVAPIIAGGFDVDYLASGDPDNPEFWVGGSETRMGQSLAEVFFDATHSVVNSKNTIPASMLRKFISGGKPVSLGADGSTPFSVQPALYFKGNAAAFVTNLGSAGAFTLEGSITTTATSPSD